MLKRTLLCLLLAVSLLPGPAALAVKWEYPASAHPAVDYGGMLPVTPFDETVLQAALTELDGICSRHSRQREDRETRRRVRALYEQVLEEMNVLITKANLSGVQYDASGGAEAEAALYLELSAQQTRLYDQCYRVLGSLAASPYRDILDDSAGEGAADSMLGYEGLPEGVSALYDEEDRLVQAYDRLIARDVLPEEKAERDRAAGELYRQLLRLRSSIAGQAGYDSYTEYAYSALYNRDYAPEDIRPLREAAKRYILPLQLRLLEELDQQDLRALSIRSRKSGEEILDAIRPFIRDFDREMGETFDFMRAHHLYDIEYGAEKLNTGYTVALPAYGSAFIFNAPYGDYQDYSDTVHEFGHFNETFHCTRHDLWTDFNIDVGEIHSQALELMFTSSAGSLFGERYGEVYAKAILYNILDSILDGCLYDEFQAAAYADPDMTVEELGRLFKTLSEEYGYSYESGVEADASWIEVSHNFQNPLYFISYATSALSALDLWFLYLDAPGQAREVYLELSALSLSLPYRAAVEEAGLRDIFDPETVPALAEELEARMDGGSVSRGGLKAFLWAGRPHPAALLVMKCVAAVFILFCVIAILRCTRFLNKHDGWKYLSRPGRSSPGPQRPEEPENSWSPKTANPSEDPWSAPPKKPPWEF